MGAVMMLVFPAEMVRGVVLQEGENEVRHLVSQYSTAGTILRTLFEFCLSHVNLLIRQFT